MKDEIEEILDKMKNYSGECHSILAYSLCGYKKKIRNDFRMCMNDIDKLLDYITNLQKSQETLIKNDNEIITNLQQENQDIKDTLQDKLDYIGHLKELCDKYEEEHNTKFNEWVFDKRENERLTQGVTLLTNKIIDMTKEIENQSNEIDVLKDQVEWWKQQCDDLEMQIGENN